VKSSRVIAVTLFVLLILAVAAPPVQAQGCSGGFGGQPQGYVQGNGYGGGYPGTFNGGGGYAPVEEYGPTATDYGYPAQFGSPYDTFDGSFQVRRRPVVGEFTTPYVCGPYGCFPAPLGFPGYYPPQQFNIEIELQRRRLFQRQQPQLRIQAGSYPGYYGGR
jgi:hypothetical protein